MDIGVGGQGHTQIVGPMAQELLELAFGYSILRELGVLQHSGPFWIGFGLDDHVMIGFLLYDGRGRH